MDRKGISKGDIQKLARIFATFTSQFSKNGLEGNIQGRHPRTCQTFATFPSLNCQGSMKEISSLETGTVLALCLLVFENNSHAMPEICFGNYLPVESDLLHYGFIPSL